MNIPLKMPLLIVGFSKPPFKSLPAPLTSSPRPGPRPCPKPRYSTSLPLTAAEACSQHSFHLLVLYGILGVAQTLRLLDLLAATRSAAVAAGTIPTTLKERDRMKGNKNLETCILSILRSNMPKIKHKGKHPTC